VPECREVRDEGYGCSGDEICGNLSILVGSSSGYSLYRFDPLTGSIYILAAGDISLSITQQGNLEFEDDTEL
jgi:hypothetical protein